MRRNWSFPETVDAFLVSDQVNIYYLTGFCGVSFHDREAYLLLTRDKKYLLTSRLYAEKAETLQESLSLHFFGPQNSLGEFLSRFSPKRLGVESTSLTIQEASQIKKAAPDVTMTQFSDAIESIREKKDTEEMMAIGNACKLTDACFQMIPRMLRRGISERELAWSIETFFHKNKACSAFSPIVAFTQGSSEPHHTSNNSKLTKSTLIQLDFGALLNGYNADLSRVIFYGTPKSEWVTTYQGVLKAQQSAIDYIASTPDPLASVADQKARDTLKASEYPEYPHSLGHGVGMSIHEKPRLGPTSTSKIANGMVFTLEPAVYLPGNFGIRIEDTFCFLNGKLESLTKSVKEPLFL